MVNTFPRSLLDTSATANTARTPLSPCTHIANNFNKNVFFVLGLHFTRLFSYKKVVYKKALIENQDFSIQI